MTANHLKELNTEKASLGRSITTLENELRTKRRRVGEIDKKINSLTSREIIISDHAIIRLLERRFGQAEMIEKVINQIKRELEVKKLPRDCKITLDGDLQGIIKENTLITVK